MQALDWALRSHGRLRGEGDRFWVAAAAYDAVSQTPVRSQEDARVLDFVSRAVDGVVAEGRVDVSLGLQFPAFARLDADPPPAPPPMQQRKRGRVIGGIPDPGEGDGELKYIDAVLYSGPDGFTPEVDLDNLKCCPMKFVYDAVPQTEECPEDKVTRVYWNLYSQIKYSNAYDKEKNVECFCPCCAFSQVVIRSKFILSGAPPEFTTMEEDCKCGRLIPGTHQLETVPCDDPSAEQQICYGDEPPSPWLHPPTPDDPVPNCGESRGWEHRNVPCEYSHHDEPGMRVPWGSTFKMDHLFVGIIWNLCPARTVHSAKFIRMKSEGSVGATGELAITTPPSERVKAW